MKKIYFFFFLLVQAVFAQAQMLKLYATDALGNRDSVQIGINWQATLGVDSAFNEVNLFATPADSVLDMRVIQRDSANHFCLRQHPFISSPAAPALYFPENLDLKTDIRIYDNYDSPYWHNFQIWVRAQHYPVIISADPILYWNNYLDWSVAATLDSTCSYGSYFGLGFSSNPDSLVVLSSPGVHSLAVYFDHEVSRPELQEVNPWKVVQNPVASRLTIQMQKPEYGTLQLLDGLGRVVRNYALQGVETEQFHCSDLPSGFYFLRLQTPLNPVSRLRKILKQ